MKTITLAAALAVFAATGAAANDKADQPAAGDPKAEKKICQSEHVTGSLARTQEICMTRAEWDALRHRSKEQVDDVQRNFGAVAGQSGGMGSSSGIVR
jgi:hypothetical protein